MYSAARPPHAHIITGTLWVLGSGAVADAGGGGGEGAKGAKGAKGAGYSSNATRGGVGQAAGGVVVVRGSCSVLRSSCHRERGTDVRLRAYAHALPF